MHFEQVTITGLGNHVTFVLEKLREVASPNDYIPYIQLFLAEVKERPLGRDELEAIWDRLPDEMHALNRAYRKWKNASYTV